MHKLPLTGVMIALLMTTGCSTVGDTVSGIGDAIPKALERTPLFYKIDVQQGNSVEQPMVNRLEPGMSKNQVRFIMGSPMLVDVFHQNRWDYYYRMKRGNGEMEESHIALFFEDDRLVRTEGSMRPLPIAEMEDLKSAEVFSVPDYTYEKGIFSRMMHRVGLEEEE